MSTPDATATTTSMDTFTHFDKRFSLEKLTDDGTTNTYGTWVGVAKSKLQLLNLWKYISGPESVAPVIPKLIADARFEATEESSGEKKWFIQKGNKDEVEEATKKAEPWARGNLAARTVLLEALSPEKRSLISEDDSAKFIWEFLTEEYRPLNFARSQVQFQNIMKFTCKPGMDVWKWCEKLRELYVELRNYSPTRIKDTDFAVTIANLLPATPGWAEFGGRLFDALTKAENEGKPLSSAAVFAMVRNYDWAQKKNDPQVAAEAYNTDTLYPDSKRPGSPIANQTSSKRAKPSNSKDQDYCENPKCSRPRGHKTRNCLCWGGEKCGQYPEGWRGRTDLHLPPDQRSDTNKSTGTFKNKSKTFNQPRANAAHAANCSAEGSDDEAQVAAALCQEGEYYAFNVICGPDPVASVTCNTLALMSTSNSKPAADVYHDSGANRHIFYDKSVFNNYRKISHIQVKGFGSSLATSAIGVGDVHLAVTINGVMSTVKLSDALHVPSARLNLVSQGCLQRRGVDCIMKDGKVVLSTNGKTIMVGRIQPNNLYRLHVQPISRNLAGRIEANHASLADRISSAPLIDRISPHPISAATSVPMQKPQNITEGFCTA